jgi:hypothetical protein
MTRICLVLLVCLLSGCAGLPPAPPDCEGPLQPINEPSKPSATEKDDATRPRS